MSQIFPQTIDAFRAQLLGVVSSSRRSMSGAAGFAHQMCIAAHPQHPHVAVAVVHAHLPGSDAKDRALHFYKIEAVAAGQPKASEALQKFELNRAFWSEINVEEGNVLAMSVSEIRAIFLVFDCLSCRAWRPSCPGSLLVSFGRSIVLFQGLLTKKTNYQVFSSDLLRSSCALSWHPSGEYAHAAPWSHVACRR
jgi:hypothetical protein